MAAPAKASTSRASPGATTSLLYINAFDQSIFIGLFFWVSGRVSAQSFRWLDVTWTMCWAFVRGKLLSLGLPWAIYTLVVLTVVPMAAHPIWKLVSVSRQLAEVLHGRERRQRGQRGPLANLLLLDVAAALTVTNEARESISTGNPTTDGSAPRALPFWYGMARRWGWVGVAGVSFLVRLRYPVGETIKPVALQPSYAAQYIFAYAMGFVSLGLGPIFTVPFVAVKPERDDTRPSTTGGRLISSSLISPTTILLVWLLPRLWTGGSSSAVQMCRMASGPAPWVVGISMHFCTRYGTMPPSGSSARPHGLL
ncbi:hypothetical protein JDV02_004051 [Purpureocillium takamizusanense]|uniref:Uncharacterized protein n=1 Tax=Purpureocillium takamizusanense TaxID=2060973 RepID=A0A9Q8QDP0_9HYPO|nr:uncharacterized protein JDV02_004051 [Purpureocillium takamizusanense]UNI17730.1 hypothetical protein JDV02_004051 [Purpureocillium takamizusanense]